ncbi:hypothetical protein KSS87_007191 [Heliosperma pusillum]|nr:hypothetical protein KSS87_007191 [Heliosperma pusillum]
MKEDTVEIPKKKKVYISDEDDWDLPNSDLPQSSTKL